MIQSKTKEEILATKNWNSEYPNYMAESNIHEAMDEYSQQQCIAFAEFLGKKKCTAYANMNGEIEWCDPYYNYKATEDLYDSFTEEQLKQTP